MKISYQWLSELVDLTLNPKELAERLTMAGLAVESVERLGDDHILDFDLTSNRPDALSHLGIAREAALVCETAPRPRSFKLEETGEPVENLTSIEILDADLCPRYAGRVVTGVKVGPSPKWLVDRLESIGQRPVNNIADITNYVMFEMGQPTHAFDLDLLHGKRIIVRRARAGEQLRTLDGFDRELSPDVLVIADADRAVALAGVMGGEDTEITSETRDVLIESAYFDPASIRRTARALEIDTEASYRFSRGADFEAQARAADMVARMIAEIAGGRISPGILDVRPLRPERKPVSLRAARVERLTGLKVSAARCAAILTALEFKVDSAGDGSLVAVPPSFRVDISCEEDVVEEVARHTGYDLVDTVLPEWAGAGSSLVHEDRRRAVRRTLTGLGFHEAVCFSFANAERDALFRRAGEEPVVLANPIDVNESQMRTSLVPGLLASLQHNLNQGNRDVALFELGRVFTAAGEGERPVEREMLALIVCGDLRPGSWRDARPVEFADLKGAVEAVLDALNVSGFTITRAGVEYLHPGQAATFSRDGQEIVRLGRLHPRVGGVYKFRQPVYLAEVEFRTLVEIPADEVRYRPLPRYPASSRDVSVLVPENVAWADVEAAIAGLGIAEIESVSVFDMFKGKGIAEGFKSLAFRVIYRSETGTLVEDRISAFHERVTDLLQERFGARIR